MSVLLAYGTGKEAVIMSDSRGTYYDDNHNILGFEDNRQKIFKITDKFIIGSVGNGNSKNILENVNPNNPNSHFYIFKDYTYEKWLEFFAKRIKIFGIDKLSYSPYISIGIDSNNQIRMDTFNNISCEFDTIYPDDNNFVSTIYLPPNIDPNFKTRFFHELKDKSDLDKEKYCRHIINRISQIDETVGGDIQYFKVQL